jgi:hypothetical protein
MSGRPAHIIDKQLIQLSHASPLFSSSKVHVSPHFPQFKLTPLCTPNIQHSFTKNFQRSHTVRAIQPITQTINITLGTVNKMNMMYSAWHEGQKMSSTYHFDSVNFQKAPPRRLTSKSVIAVPPQKASLQWPASTPKVLQLNHVAAHISFISHELLLLLHNVHYNFTHLIRTNGCSRNLDIELKLRG